VFSSITQVLLSGYKHLDCNLSFFFFLNYNKRKDLEKSKNFKIRGADRVTIITRAFKKKMFFGGKVFHLVTVT